MTKVEIFEIMGEECNLVENENRSALCVTISSENIDVEVTIPYGVHEMFFEAKDKQGANLVSDQFDFYGDMEVEDYKETLQDIVDVSKSPILRLTNNGKTIEAKGYKWYYFFGKFVS